MIKEKQVKYRIEHRLGYEEFEWMSGNVSDLIFLLPDLCFKTNHYGIILPYHILNEVLMHGESDGGMSGYAAWVPISLSEAEYQLVLSHLLDHPEYEMVCDEELECHLTLEKWTFGFLKKYKDEMVNVKAVIDTLKSENKKGKKCCIELVGSVVFQKKNNPSWHKIKHITEAEVNQMLLEVERHINDKGDYTIYALQALSYSELYETKFVKWLDILGRKDSEIAYWVIIYLNRFDHSKYPLDDSFFSEVPNDVSTTKVLKQILD